jgi:hypothetical protein
MKQPPAKKFLVSCALVATLGVTSISASSYAPVSAKTTPHDPFSLDVSYMHLEGYTEGLMPGETYEYKITLRNTEKTEWHNRYLVSLIDENGIEKTVVENSFDLGPETNTCGVITLKLPKDLKEGAYGLSVAVPDRGRSVTTIHVGEDNGNFVKPWPNAFPVP